MEEPQPITTLSDLLTMPTTMPATPTPFLPRTPFAPSPVLKTDFYKQGHKDQYPVGTERVMTNLTARGSRLGSVQHVVHFGTQAAFQKLQEDFEHNFFRIPQQAAVNWFARRLITSLGLKEVDTSHIKALHDLGFLPLDVWALPEGDLVPLRVPLWVMFNTKPEFFWLTNFIETTVSCNTWGPLTSATTANEYRKILASWASRTNPEAAEFVQWQGHDFSYRGMFGDEAACQSGAGHLLSFTGTDTIPAIDWLEHYYHGNADRELLGGSVYATEHSVMCMGTEEGELETFKRLITEVYPSNVVSIVSDTWNLWDVVCPEHGYLLQLKDIIENRDGKVVVRPDSGDPVRILCGYNETDRAQMPRSQWDKLSELERKGVVECLWDIFGGTESTAGYRVLAECIGTIYGDSITLDRAEDICQRLADKGFASTNVVLGIGSFTYQGAITPQCIVTRDSFGLALKSTYGEVDGEPRNIFKDPVTDDGLKRSARGITVVVKDEHGGYQLKDESTWEDFFGEYNQLSRIFKDGEWFVRTTVSEVRQRLKNSN